MVYGRNLEEGATHQYFTLKLEDAQTENLNLTHMVEQKQDRVVNFFSIVRENSNRNSNFSKGKTSRAVQANRAREANQD